MHVLVTVSDAGNTHRKGRGTGSHSEFTPLLLSIPPGRGSYRRTGDQKPGGRKQYLGLRNKEGQGGEVQITEAG